MGYTLAQIGREATSTSFYSPITCPQFHCSIVGTPIRSRETLGSASIYLRQELSFVSQFLYMIFCAILFDIFPAICSIICRAIYHLSTAHVYLLQLDGFISPAYSCRSNVFVNSVVFGRSVLRRIAQQSSGVTAYGNRVCRFPPHLYP